MELATAALLLAAVGTGTSIVNSISAAGDASKQAAVQQRLAALQARQKQIETQRAARIRRAQLVASGAAQGAPGSSLTAGITALQTQTANQVNLYQQGLTLQQQQFDLQADQTVAGAYANIAASLGNFAATALTPTGKDNLSLVDRALKG